MLNNDNFLNSKVLLVDDNPANVLLLRRIFESAGYTNLNYTHDATEVLNIWVDWEPDLIILDLHMPKMTGYEVLAEIKMHEIETDFTPVLIFSADVTPDAKRRALEAGASDFLTKPGDATEILLRSRNFLKMRALYKQLDAYNCKLEERVRERTEELHHAHLEVVERLALTAEYRDDDTGAHAQRVGEMAASIGLKLGLDPEEAATLELAAKLHDMGKVGIPDSILLKEGRLTEAEFSVMQDHTEIGAKICGGSSSPILKLAETICISHHEKWTGGGYPNNLSGEDIPLVGRIVAVADVYDALRSERPYKAAMSHEATVAEIVRCSGTHFDPRVVEAFLAYIDEISVSELQIAA